LGATPLSRRTLVLSQIALRLMIALAQTVIILAFGRLAFGVQLGDQIPLMIGFILLGGLTFVAMGYMVAALARTEAAGNAIVQALQFPMMFLSGVYFPLDFAPDWMGDQGDAADLPGRRLASGHGRGQQQAVLPAGGRAVADRLAGRQPVCGLLLFPVGVNSKNDAR
jgi:hypothetical protein